jgi:hypothetical protein
VAATTFVGYAPLVNASLRTEWETFSVQSQGWVDIGLAHENRTKTKSVTGMGIPEQIYRLDEQGEPMVVGGDEDPGPYFPIWQHAPVYEDSVNFHLVSHPEFQTESHVAISMESIVLGLISEPKSGNQIVGASDDPFSHLYFPVFSDFEEMPLRQLVALLISTVDWTQYLRDANFPYSANDIQCVLTNGCGQAYTYEVQEETPVVFLTEGGAHDKDYDSLEESILLQQDAFLSYNNLEFNTEFCPCSLRVFPSESTEKAYYTKRPAIYTAVMGLVFLFTSITFFSYDYLVER